MSKIRESVIEDYLVRRVEEIGGLCLKWKSPGRKNVMDSLCFFPQGIHALVEAKRPGETFRPAQAREAARFSERGHVPWLVSIFEEVDAFIDEAQSAINARILQCSARGL